MKIRAAMWAAAAWAAIGTAWAGQWPTFGYDPQRTGWAKTEDTLSPANVSKMKIEWSLKLDNQALEYNALTAPVVAERVITPEGFKDIVYVAGSSDHLFAIDADAGKLLWSKTFTRTAQPKQKPHWLCPNALNATPVLDRRAKTIYVVSSDGMLHSLSLVNGEDMKPPVALTPPFAKMWSLNLYGGMLYTVTSQGCNGVKSAVYGMDLKDPARPVKKYQVSTAGGGIWGRAGAAISSATGDVYVETGDGPFDPAAGKLANSFVAVTPQLTLADYYTPANYQWIDKKDLDMGDISPVVFPFRDKELVAGGGKEGVLYLLDAKLLGGADHRTPMYRSPRLLNDRVDFAGHGFWGALSTWEDAQKTRWLLAPAWGPPAEEGMKFPVSYGATPDGSVMAFKVVDKDGRAELAPAWMSENMEVPEPVAIANGVVFALATGENVQQVDSDGNILNSAQREAGTKGHAVLYALDAETGKTLYSSGDGMKGFAHFSGLAVSNGRVFAVTHDSTVYAFGLGEENP
jgi:outer membrane protein assembly factor BamB